MESPVAHFSHVQLAGISDLLHLFNGAVGLPFGIDLLVPFVPAHVLRIVGRDREAPGVSLNVRDFVRPEFRNLNIRLLRIASAAGD